MSTEHLSTIVVVGHGMVGQRFLEALAERGATGRTRVVVLCEEPRPAYDRVHLTSYFEGRTPDELSLVPDDFMRQHGIELYVDDPAESVDRAARTVTARSGRTFAYDTLVLATGSYPFVPPVPGKDTPGCFVYRTIEDLLAIEEYAKTATTGAVVGGGLLGLEAAGALRGLGLTTHIVEFAPRLMPVQVDEGGGAALLRTIENMGLTVHTGVGTQEITAGEEGRVNGMTLSDSSHLSTDLVVFSAGVRPRDQLARDCGLAVGERGGIVVDERCRTSDPSVFAIGECALASDGRVYGLVAPGYDMAQTAADAIAATAGRTFTGRRLVDQTEAARRRRGVVRRRARHAPTAASTSSTRTRVPAIYKKLVVSVRGRAARRRPGRRRRRVRHAAAAHRARAARLPRAAGPAGRARDAGRARPGGAAGRRGHLLLPQRDQGRDRRVLLDCPRSRSAPRPVRAAAVASRPSACCSPKSGDGGLCGCFAQTRQELYEIALALRIGSFTELLDGHGRAQARGGEGCEICKPTIASILAGLGNGHILDGEQAALQDTNDHFLANLQRNGSYSVVPRIPGGEITPDKLIVIGEVARDFGLYTKITGGQRIDLFGARVDQLPAIWARLVDAGFESGHAYGKSLRTVKSCVGQTWCRYGVQDSVRMAIDLELRYRGLRSPHKLKSAVSGCARECAEAQSKDFGVIATANGWNLYVGGNGGASPRHADLLAQDLTDDELVRLIDRFLMFYIRTADRLERTSVWLERIEGGLSHVKDVVVNDSLGICAELEALMAAHVAGYRDEWAETLDDPERLARFVSFVNAPGTPDPSVRFVPERDQIKPELPLLTLGATR